MRNLLVVPILAVMMACAAEPPKPKSAPAATSSAEAAGSSATAPSSSPQATAATPPVFVLAETPADKLGTAPAGFGPKVGEKAPDATLPDITGRAQRLANLYAQGPTLVIFYRGGWCPFCNLQLHEFSKAKPEFDSRGIRIVAISVDKPSEEAKTQAKHGVPFPMLSDSKLVAHQKYRVVHVPGDEERQKLAAYKLDLAAYSGESHGNFAVPAVLLVDKAGIVRFVHVDEEYKTRPSVKQMLAVVDRTFP
jgi:peroxiredoxin